MYTASASPSASIVVVEAVGASPSAQASCAIEQSSATSAAAAKVDNLFIPLSSRANARDPLLLSSANLIPRHRNQRHLQPLDRRQQRQISPPSPPIADSASTTSPRTTIPKSPCSASTGCRYSAGVPVELSVAAILRAISPLFPIPVTTTRPAQPNINSTARWNASRHRPANAIRQRPQRLRLNAHHIFASMFHLKEMEERMLARMDPSGGP